MSITLALVLIAVTAVLGLGGLLNWLLKGPGEEHGAATAKPVVVQFFDAAVWNAFRRWGQNKPLQLSYRRDRRGRFRKLP